jgi:aminopeptidase N
MRDPTPVTVRLEDYTPPAFLIATVDLDVDIREDHARVRARLAVRRNPAAPDARAPLVLDGDELVLESVAVDGRTLAAAEYALDAERLTIAAVPDAFTLLTRCGSSRGRTPS